MTRSNAFIFGAAALAAGFVLAQTAIADTASGPAGTWTYKVGHTDTPCMVTLTTGSDGQAGDITSAKDCPGGLLAIGHWRINGSQLRLMSPSGEIVAILRAKGGNYVGHQFGGGRDIELSR